RVADAGARQVQREKRLAAWATQRAALDQVSGAAGRVGAAGGEADADLDSDVDTADRGVEMTRAALRRAASGGGGQGEDGPDGRDEAADGHAIP
ncbi:MAG: hypothetical protein M3442_02015, partial [Chloroflexota bacterium]|nr:hypothetical protein [Chloroflexota bacterium]